MRTVVVDVPYEIRILGVPKRKRTSDIYFVRETVPVEIACHDASEIEGRITNLDVDEKILATHVMVADRLFAPVGWVGREALRHDRHMPSVPLRLDDMEILATACRTKDGLAIGNNPFRLLQADRRGKSISRYHEKRLAGLDDWNAVEETDAEAAKADAVSKASAMAVVDGTIHTALHQPVLSTGNGRDWRADTVDVSDRHSRTAHSRPTFGFQEPVARFARQGPTGRTTVEFGRIACCGLLRDAMALVVPDKSPETASIGSGSLVVGGISAGLVDAVFGCRAAIRTVDDRNVADDVALRATLEALEEFERRLSLESAMLLNPSHGYKGRVFLDSLAASTEKLAALVPDASSLPTATIPRAA